MQSYGPEQFQGLLAPQAPQMLQPWETWAWQNHAAYAKDWVAVKVAAPVCDTEKKVPPPHPELPPPETKLSQEWKAVEEEPEESRGIVEWPRAPQQTTLLLIVCGLFLFLVLTGMPMVFYI